MRSTVKAQWWFATLIQKKKRNKKESRGPAKAEQLATENARESFHRAATRHWATAAVVPEGQATSQADSRS